MAATELYGFPMLTAKNQKSEHKGGHPNGNLPGEMRAAGENEREDTHVAGKTGPMENPDKFTSREGKRTAQFNH